MMVLSRFLFFILVGLLPLHAQAATLATHQYRDWLMALEEEAIAAGISPPTVHSALDNMLPDDRVLTLDQKQPEKTVTFDAYLKNILSPQRVAQGRTMLEVNAGALAGVAKKYGVPPEMIVALWGVESAYGRNMGNFSVVESLLTLAYEGRRADFFRAELLNALRILDAEHMDVADLRGSWAGAMGQCQFMPSTYMQHAVDYNEDGKRDIWSDHSDVWASIANYLAYEGWQADLKWGRSVELDQTLPASEVGLDVRHSLSEWKALGVNVPDEILRAKPSLEASLIQPDGADGRSFLVYDSFRAIMKWNRSTYFATAVGLLADRIRQ